MSYKRLQQAIRNQIIYDFINGIPNEEYEVKKTKDDKYQVRKRKSPFIPPAPEEPVSQKEEQEQQQEQSVKEEELKHKDESSRITNEELLMKLSSLLDLKKAESSEQSDDCGSSNFSEDEYIQTAPAPTINEIQQNAAHKGRYYQQQQYQPQQYQQQMYQSQMYSQQQQHSKMLRIPGLVSPLKRKRLSLI